MILSTLNPYPLFRREVERKLEDAMSEYGPQLLALAKGQFSIESSRSISFSGVGEHLTFGVTHHDEDARCDMKAVVLRIEPRAGLRIELVTYNNKVGSKKIVQTDSGYRLTSEDSELAAYHNKVVSKQIVQTDSGYRLTSEDSELAAYHILRHFLGLDISLGAKMFPDLFKHGVPRDATHDA